MLQLHSSHRYFCDLSRHHLPKATQRYFHDLNGNEWIVNGFHQILFGCFNKPVSAAKYSGDRLVRSKLLTSAPFRMSSSSTFSRPELKESMKCFDWNLLNYLLLIWLTIPLYAAVVNADQPSLFLKSISFLAPFFSNKSTILSWPGTMVTINNELQNYFPSTEMIR